MIILGMYSGKTFRASRNLKVDSDFPRVESEVLMEIADSDNCVLFEKEYMISVIAISVLAHP